MVSRGELTINGSVHLRARDYTPSTGTFTSRDAVDGDNGMPTVSNPYHYTYNDPLNNADPNGMHSGPSNDADHSAKPTVVKLSLNSEAMKPFEALGRVELAGFIPEDISQLGPYGLFKGDNRPFANGPIPVDHSRFYMSLDFAASKGYVHVNPTCPVDGPCGDAWPVSFNPDINWGFHASLWQHNTYMAIEPGGDGQEIVIRWSVVHGGRQTFNGIIPTELTRLAFDGTLSIRHLGDRSYSVQYDGDCFPSVEAYAVGGNGSRVAIMQMASEGPHAGIAFWRKCHVNYSGSV